MKINETQAKEIETIKERTITLKLSDADCERIARKAGLGGQTVSELLKNFIGDLIDGTYSNGSDERDKADQWYQRCWFSWMNEDTLIHYLLDWGHDVDDFLTTYDELKYFEANPQEFAAEVAELEDGEMLWFQEEYQDYVSEYLEKHKDVDLEKEIELCRKWLKDLQELKGDKGIQEDEKEKTEKSIMKIRDEFESFIEEVKKLPIESIIEKAYEISFKTSIAAMGEKELELLEELENPLEVIYQEWLSKDTNGFENDLSHLIKEIRYNYIDKEKLKSIEQKLHAGENPEKLMSELNKVNSKSDYSEYLKKQIEESISLER